MNDNRTTNVIAVGKMSFVSKPSLTDCSNSKILDEKPDTMMLLPKMGYGALVVNKLRRYPQHDHLFVAGQMCERKNASDSP